MKHFVAFLMTAAVAACSNQTNGVVPNPAFPDVSARSAGTRTHSRAHHATASNVYVDTECVGSAFACSNTSGEFAILRFTAGEDTSTPNETLTVNYAPKQMAVSQYNGRVAVVHGGVNKVTVYNQSLSKLYDITPHRVRGTELPIAVAYDSSGNLYISQFEPVYGFGYVLEYYGNDTSADKTWTFNNAGHALDPVAITAGAALWVVGSVPGYSYTTTVVLICSNTSSIVSGADPVRGYFPLGGEGSQMARKRFYRRSSGRRSWS